MGKYSMRFSDSYNVKKYKENKRREIARIQANLCEIDMNREQAAKVEKKPVIGPRNKLYNYVFNLKMDKEAAKRMVLQEYTSYSEEMLDNWLSDEKAIEKWKNDINREGDDLGDER